MKFNIPKIRELEAAKKAFEQNEPRDLFYRAATELVDQAIQGNSSLSLAEALAVLLQTWNSAYYRYSAFDNQHFTDIENIVNINYKLLLKIRERSIETFFDGDKPKIKQVFVDFEEVLGPVGAAKCLHLLAPKFFPLWDRAIAKAYNLPLKKRGNNGDSYCLFMEISKEQCESIRHKKTVITNPLKAIDEYNYCRYTKQWLGD
jgi:hypothetical protein